MNMSLTLSFFNVFVFFSCSETRLIVCISSLAIFLTQIYAYSQESRLNRFLSYLGSTYIQENHYTTLSLKLLSVPRICNNIIF